MFVLISDLLSPLGADWVKKTRVRTFKSEFEALMVKEIESVDEFAGKIRVCSAPGLACLTSPYQARQAEASQKHSPAKARQERSSSNQTRP